MVIRVCHEPDGSFRPCPCAAVDVNEWRWQLAKIPKNKTALPE